MNPIHTQYPVVKKIITRHNPNPAVVSTPQPTQTKSAAEFFMSWFERVNYEIPYLGQWSTSEGVLDGAINDKALHEVLPPGTLGRCQDQMGRPILFVGTDWGPVAVYRLDPQDPTSLKCQLPPKLAKHGMGYPDYLSLDELHILLGNEHCSNIGQ